jgi:hypothetical protein
MITAPGLREHLAQSGYALVRVHDGTGYTWDYDPAAQSLIDGYTVDQARDYLKHQVDLIEAQKFDDALLSAYGFIPPAQQMLKWPIKEAEASAWQAWDDGGNVGDEPPTPVIDKEVTTSQSRAIRVAKVIAKGAALEALRGAIEQNSVALDDQLDDADSFAALVLVNIQSGWPV